MPGRNACAPSWKMVGYLRFIHGMIPQRRQILRCAPVELSSQALPARRDGIIGSRRALVVQNEMAKCFSTRPVDNPWTPLKYLRKSLISLFVNYPSRGGVTGSFGGQSPCRAIAIPPHPVAPTTLLFFASARAVRCRSRPTDRAAGRPIRIQ